jgi:hypothetical protein
MAICPKAVAIFKYFSFEPPEKCLLHTGFNIKYVKFRTHELFDHEAVHRPCAFGIRIDMPLQTGKAVFELLVARNILLDSFHMQVIGGGEAILSLHGWIERDRIRHVQRSLEKINGVLSLELLEGKGSRIG